MQITQHAQKRLQQRGIPEAAIDLLLDFGQSKKSRGGLEVVYLSRLARRMLEAKTVNRVNPHFAPDTYLVVSSDGYVVTAGHRFRRIKTH